MLKRWMIVGLMMLGAQAWGAEAPPSAEEALASRFAEMGRSLLQSKIIIEETWQQSSALIQAACQLDPKNHRYARMLVEAMLQSRDSAGAIDALKSYRELCPDDETAQVQLIDLYTSRAETADARLQYLQRLLEQTDKIVPEVRSHIAVQRAMLLLDQSRPTEAAAMIDEAIRLNPLNVAALRARYAQLLQRSGFAEQRVGALLDLIRANPAKLTYASALAGELADAGMVEASLAWYSMVLNMSRQGGESISLDVGVDWAAELTIADRTPSAIEFLKPVLKSGQDHPDAALLAGVLSRAGIDEKDAAELRQVAANILSNRLAVVRKQAGNARATTRPVTDPAPPDVPDVTDELRRLKESGSAQLIPDFVTALTDLAWYHLYCSDQPAAALKAIEALRLVLPAESVTLARLEGWSYLREGKAGEAKVKLSAVAQRDPLSALGLLKIEAADPDAQAHVAAEARKLLSAHPSGLVGAILFTGTREWSATIQPSEQAPAIQQQLDAFPMAWLKILDDPQKFYVLRAETVAGKVTHAFGEPMLLKITLQNVGDYDLAMGEEGVLRPDLWFDARFRGLAEDQLPAIAFDRIAKRLVLHRREVITQVVRLDQGRLGATLSLRPHIGVQIAGTVIINPTMRNYQSVPSAAGQRASLPLLQRAGVSVMGPPREKIFLAVNNATGADKIRLLEFCARIGEGLRSDQATDEARSLAAEYIAVVRKATGEPAPLINGWARYVLARLVDVEQRQNMIGGMLKDKERECRLLGLVVLQALPIERQAAMVKDLLKSEPDAAVRRYAYATEKYVEFVMSSPTTAPATQSTTRPANGPDRP